MKYLIDGHNLIGRSKDIHLGDPNDEAKLVARLKSFANRTKSHCFVVFDKGSRGGKSELSSKTVEVRFVMNPKIADTLLIEKMQEIRDPNNYIVVSSDREVVEAARRYRIKAMPSEEFADKLNPPSKNNLRDDKMANIFPSDMKDFEDLFLNKNDDDGKNRDYESNHRVKRRKK